MNAEDLNAFVRKNMICVVCVAVSLGILVTMYLRSDVLPAAEGVLADKTKEGELIAANIEDSKSLKEQFGALVVANDAIANRMIHVGQLAENLGYFYKLESDTNTKLTDLRQLPWQPPGKNAPKTSFTPVTFSVTAQGDYPQLMDLLRRLEGGEHYCRILSCSLRPTGEQRGVPLIMTVSLDLMGVQ